MKLPKLHLRDLFWLVLVCALGVGWWVDHRSNRQLAAQCNDALQQCQDRRHRDDTTWRIAIGELGQEVATKVLQRREHWQNTLWRDR
jgi:hypothetical protein